MLVTLLVHWLARMVGVLTEVDPASSTGHAAARFEMKINLEIGEEDTCCHCPTPGWTGRSCLPSVLGTSEYLAGLFRMQRQPVRTTGTGEELAFDFQGGGWPLPRYGLQIFRFSIFREKRKILGHFLRKTKKKRKKSYLLKSSKFEPFLKNFWPKISR